MIGMEIAEINEFLLYYCIIRFSTGILNFAASLNFQDRKSALF